MRYIPTSVITVLFCILSIQLSADTTTRISGMMNGVLYTLSSSGMEFRLLGGEPSNASVSVAWESPLNETEIFFLDEEGNYFQIESLSDNSLVWHDQKVLFQNIYPNIDLIVHPTNLEKQGITYEFVVFPGGNPSDIKLNTDQDLQVPSIRTSSLMAFQDEAGISDQSVSIDILEQEQELSFQIGSYEQAQPLTIQFELSVEDGSFSFPENLAKE